MRHLMTNLRSGRDRTDQGAVAIAVAVGMTMLLVVTAMVLDFGVVRLDRQHAKAATDSSVMAGLRAADAGDDAVRAFAGVCGALSFLRANDPSLQGLPAGICASPSPTALCDPAAPAVYQGTVTNGGVTSSVTIKSPYLVSDGSFPEEGYASLVGDPGTVDGCDQIGVILTRSRQPGLGSLATSGQLRYTVRSVGRVAAEAGDRAPALLLLERTRCSVLTVGSAGSPSRIRVFGSGTMPATVHSDSAATAADCGAGSNQQLFQGKQINGVVAYGAPGTSGAITSFATQLGRPADVVADSISNVYGTSALNEFAAGSTNPVTARGQVTRRPVDRRYLAALKLWSQEARAEWIKSPAAPAGYTSYGCNPNMAALAALPSSAAVYINCPSNSGITLNGVIGAGTIYFHGFIKNGKVAMPNARRVYIDNATDAGTRINASALTLGNNNGFCVRALACDTLSVGTCSLAPTMAPSTSARLYVRHGSLDATGGLLRLCNTAALVGGGDAGIVTAPGACLPATNGTAPTATPCPAAPISSGDGFVSLSGQTDWTAPNRYGDMLALGMTTAQQQAAWNDGEDLSLWTETYGVGPAFKAAGGGNMNVAGVFMTPNAFPFTITGNGSQDLTNAQFITRGFAVDGGATLTMKVDPYNSVALPRLGPFTLVR